MNQTTYYRKPAVSVTPVVSPYQILKQKASVQDEEHPVRREIKKACTSMTFTATLEEDLPTLELFKHVPNFIAFLCTLRQSKSGEIIGQGRGTASFSQSNRSILRTIRTAVNASLIDAMARGTRVLDTLTDEPMNTNRDVFGITDKQKIYLQELISTRVNDREERERWLSQIEGFTVDEASEAIQSFKN